MTRRFGVAKLAVNGDESSSRGGGGYRWEAGKRVKRTIRVRGAAESARRSWPYTRSLSFSGTNGLLEAFTTGRVTGATIDQYLSVRICTVKVL
jgi:hypothetical protein